MKIYRSISTMCFQNIWHENAYVSRNAVKWYSSYSSYNNNCLVPKHLDDIIIISSEVRNAITNRHPIVALESAILTHGLPPKTNLDTALEVESIIRNEGAIPATICLLEGQIHVGLTNNELKILCSFCDTHDNSNTCKNTTTTTTTNINNNNNDKSNHDRCNHSHINSIKISRRDLAVCIANGYSGGTTVSGTMLIAHMLGINVFVTGGIGGVHRGGENSMDLSCDLTELGRTPVAVVCSGIKSILDIHKTLEVLETLGVTVCTLNSAEFPSFFTSNSGIRSPNNVDSVSAVSNIIAANRMLSLNSGVVVGVPIPKAHSLNREFIENIISEAILEAESRNIVGKDVTPFLLKQIVLKTNGQSLLANLALIKNNAKIGAQIASELSHIMNNNYKNPHFLNNNNNNNNNNHHHSSSSTTTTTTTTNNNNNNKPVVVGAINIDILIRHKQDNIIQSSTNEASIEETVGGVGRNIVQCLSQLNIESLFISAVGNDAYGCTVRKLFSEQSSIEVFNDCNTAKYCALLYSSGEMMHEAAQMDINDKICPATLEKYRDKIRHAPLLIIDGNLTVEAISYLLKTAYEENILAWFEPTSRDKAKKILPLTKHKKLTFISPNFHELRALHDSLFSGALGNDACDIISEAKTLSYDLLPFIPCVLVTLGEYGVLVVARDEELLLRNNLLTNPTTSLLCYNWEQRNCVYIKHYEALSIPGSIISVSGAGDCLAGATIAGLIKGHSLDESVKAGINAASLSLVNKATVPLSINSSIFST